MKRNNKKGFTIVELVIVIAVIAILAAVLIPTFSSLIKKANLSADQVAVKNMNTILMAESTLSNASSVYEAKAVLAENGLDAEEYKALTNGYAFYYDVENVCVVLVNSDGKITYPTNYEGENIDNSFVLLSSGAGSMTSVEKASSADALVSAISNKANATTMITLTDDVTLSADNIASINQAIGAGANVNLDLGGNTLTANGCISTAGGSLYVENGTVTTKYASQNGYAIAFKASSGTLHLNGVTVNAINDGSYTNAQGDTMHLSAGVFLVQNTSVIIENSAITAETYAFASNHIKSSNVYVEVINSTLTTTGKGSAAAFLNTAGTLKIVDSKIDSEGMGVFVRLGSATITNTTIGRTGNYSYGSWSEGTCVPLYAAVVVGDGIDDGYAGTASVVLNDCDLSDTNNSVTVITSSDDNTTAIFKYDSHCSGVVVQDISEDY